MPAFWHPDRVHTDQRKLPSFPRRLWQIPLGDVREDDYVDRTAKGIVDGTRVVLR